MALETAKLPLIHNRAVIHEPEWAYFNLIIIWESDSSPTSHSGHLDLLTWCTALTSALKQYLDLEGSAIHIDFLHLHQNEVWIRIPKTSMSKFSAVVSGYVGSVDGKGFGFKTAAVGEHLMALIGTRVDEAGIWVE